jgi:hypothetical protein
MLKGIHPVISLDLIHSYAAMLAPQSREGFGGIMLKCRHYSTFHLIMQMPEVAKRKSGTPGEPFKNNMTARDATEDTDLVSCGGCRVDTEFGTHIQSFGQIHRWRNYSREITGKFNFSKDSPPFCHRIESEASVLFRFALLVGFLTREYVRWSQY